VGVNYSLHPCFKHAMSVFSGLMLAAKSERLRNDTKIGAVWG